MLHKNRFILGISVSVFAMMSSAAYAQYSTNLNGALGLNTVPNARHDPAGTVRIGASTLDPFLNGFIGFQLADPLSVTLRQTGVISGIQDDPDEFLPGLDLKLRLLKERRIAPEISIGLQSAIGDRQSAGEYIALSKRYGAFDFTGGIGWGRFGTAGHFDNPLKIFGDHFGDARTIDGASPNEPEDWFTGERAGFFAGVEYFTPIKGLSLKFDYGADRYSAEQAVSDFDPPTPWGAGLNYQPASWIDIGLGTQGLDKVMARLSLQGNVKNWPKSEHKIEARSPFNPFRTNIAMPSDIKNNAQSERVTLHDITIEDLEASATLELKPHRSLPHQLGMAAKHIANDAGAHVERITLQPNLLGLHGPRIALMRSDLEAAFSNTPASAEELWHNSEITPTSFRPFSSKRREDQNDYSFRNFTATLDNQASLSEDDSGALYRTSLVAGIQAPSIFGFDNFLSLRLNLADNLERLSDLRPRVILPVRSDIDDFAERRFGLDTAFTSFTHSFKSDLHISLLGGYLEEQYAGAGGEILYRPLNTRWALGAEGFLALKRAPEGFLNYKINGDRLLSGHLQGWYDVPFHDITLNARFGRFLAEDIGGTLALQKRFNNGVELEGYVTLTDNRDFDLFGGTTSLDHGIRLSMPLGGFKYGADFAKINTRLAPFGRDIGQSIRNPLPLYDLTTPFTTNHLAQNWSDLTQ